MIGNIPRDIVIISGGEHLVKELTWDDLSATEDIKVIPAFVADAEKPNTIAKGETWAKSMIRRSISKDGPVVKETIKNIPFSGLKIISLVRRGEGRAYKVLTKEGYYFDLREDVLLDIMRNTGIEKGAMLNGEYIWAKIAGRSKIVRVGSELYNELIKNNNAYEKKKIPNSKLIPGHIYRSKSGTIALYLGVKSNLEIKILDTKYRVTYPNREVSSFDIHVSRNDKDMLWLNLPNHTVCNNDIKKTVMARITSMYDFEFKSTHSFVEDIGIVDISDIITENIRKIVEDTIEVHKNIYLYKKIDIDFNYACIASRYCKLQTMGDDAPKIANRIRDLFTYSKQNLDGLI